MLATSKYFYFIFLISLINCAEDLFNASTLRFVHVLWRHGDRSPNAGTFPTDTGNPEWTWPQGWGELTTLGIRQQFELGSYLRKRYVNSGFLSQYYNVNEIYVESLDKNDIINSAQANLLGMYPPSPKTKWSKNIGCQLVPIHTKNDSVLSVKYPCPEADRITNQAFHSNRAKKIEMENRDFLEFLEKKTGLERIRLHHIYSVFDPLNAERIHNDTHRWPDWVTPEIFDRIKNLSMTACVLMYSGSKIQRLRGSQLLFDIASRSFKKSREANFYQKYHAYSVHDVTMIALFQNLGAFEYANQMAPFASALLFELHEKENKYFMQIWYINQTGSQHPAFLRIRDCGWDYCSLDAFVEMARKKTPTNWEKECGYNRETNEQIHQLSVATEILGFTTAVFLILFTITFILLLRRRYSNSLFITKIFLTR